MIFMVDMARSLELADSEDGHYLLGVPRIFGITVTEKRDLFYSFMMALRGVGDVTRLLH